MPGAAEAAKKKIFTISIVYGATLAAKERDARLVIHEAGGYQYVDRQISQIEDLIQRRLDQQHARGGPEDHGGRPPGLC